jgi:hypothetical protein
MPALATLQTWLEEAYVARHKLRTGALAVSLSYGQRTMSYTAANGQRDSKRASAQLVARHIRLLQPRMQRRECGHVSGPCSCFGSRAVCA